MTNFDIQNDKIIVEWIFTDATEAWQIVKKLYNDWFLKTVYVWFWNEVRNSENWKIIESAELREISFVPIPANPNALSVEKMAKAVELWIIKSDDDDIPFTAKDAENENQNEWETQTDWEWEKEQKDSDILIFEELRKIQNQINDLKILLTENQKFFDTLANWKAFLSDNNEDDNSNTKVEENYKQFLQNLNKNISNSLFELKK